MFQNDFKKQVQIFQKKLNTKQVNNGRIPMDIDTINSVSNIIFFPNIIPVQTICPVPMEIDEPKKRVNMEID